MRSPARVKSFVLLISVGVVFSACSTSNQESETETPAATDLACEWPMFGHSPQRTFSYPQTCDTAISTQSANRLAEKWFFATRDVVTASPAITNGTVFVGDWSGRFYAIDSKTGDERWIFDAPIHDTVYSGQIVSSAAVAEAGGELLVYFASGKTMFAASAEDGEIKWSHELGTPGDGTDRTEIQSSPVVADGKVIFGWDAHDEPGIPAGVIALDAATGEQAWVFDTDKGSPPSGCVGVWSSPTVDINAGLAFFGTANCSSATENWRDLTEAIVAIDLHSGELRWKFQPRGPSNYDFDFAGAPNLFEIAGRGVVGLGGKDGRYYALDRLTGEKLWEHVGQDPEVNPGFSFGGFIGAASVSNGVVAAGLADNNHCPCLIGFDANTGERIWEQPAASATYGSSAVVNGVLLSGGTDFTFRAIDLYTGKVLWSHGVVGAISGGPAVSGDLIAVPTGIREPGAPSAGTDAGVYGFTVGDEAMNTTTTQNGLALPENTTAPAEVPFDPSLPSSPQCVASPCDPGFGIKAAPQGTTPGVLVWLRPSPFRIEVRGTGFGEPTGWLRPGSAAAEIGAVAYAVFANDDSLNGVLLCVLDESFDCVNTTLPSGVLSSYNRISILAIANTPNLPAPGEGFDRLVTTVALDAAVQLEAR